MNSFLCFMPFMMTTWSWNLFEYKIFKTKTLIPSIVDSSSIFFLLHTISFAIRAKLPAVAYKAQPQNYVVTFHHILCIHWMELHIEYSSGLNNRALSNLIECVKGIFVSLIITDDDVHFWLKNQINRCIFFNLRASCKYI